MAENQEQVKINVSEPRGALTMLKLTLEGDNIQMTGRAFALSNQSLVTLSKVIEENESLRKADELRRSEMAVVKPAPEGVQDIKSK